VNDLAADGFVRPTPEHLRARVRHIVSHLKRNLETLERQAPGTAAAIVRARILEGQAALELALAELHAHPEARS
jgi:hypothetical protein